ncbi:zinc ABC transporter ATP-binding protein ZnuC [Ectothiorhodospira lacustris]|uniref:zinc ABC transporter ATP-binding protein ZnuC n=1 Tax=Ectothiorhodospira lacustris TaxID=2899127 RepID=UPI001EE9488F|nr:zinc ABC transporter ATP-binding protein ZnuC [Ectothiorhodospira lacustris]MCG5508875.1 zinc ABC transporter ATP-binding protein ZnuC [Ectothiorhodospira lacustris]MCG5520666.1 zinc ABC transporter ATP-binding protein ZnuC [Ectothiorhodospira lacustris]
MFRLSSLSRSRDDLRPVDGALLAARQVALTAGGRRILDGVDMMVQPGRIVTLIGPNGAGKTSLLKVLLGLVSPSSGRVLRRPGLRIGYMPQRIQVDEILPITVRRFLGLGGRFDRDSLARVLREVGCDHLLEQPVQSVSGGEMQRILLARALLREPHLLVLDEPAQGVDVAGQGEVFQLIARLRDRYGCGVLMVSHELHLVMAAADSVICLNQHVCCTGKPDVVSRDPAYLKLFGKTMPAGMALYTHHHDHRHDLHGDVVEFDGPPGCDCHGPGEHEHHG